MERLARVKGKQTSAEGVGFSNRGLEGMLSWKILKFTVSEITGNAPSFNNHQKVSPFFSIASLNVQSSGN